MPAWNTLCCILSISVWFAVAADVKNIGENGGGNGCSCNNVNSTIRNAFISSVEANKRVLTNERKYHDTLHKSLLNSTAYLIKTTLKNERKAVLNFVEKKCLIKSNHTYALIRDPLELYIRKEYENLQKNLKETMKSTPNVFMESLFDEIKSILQTQTERIVNLEKQINNALLLNSVESLVKAMRDSIKHEGKVILDTIINLHHHSHSEHTSHAHEHDEHVDKVQSACHHDAFGKCMTSASDSATQNTSSPQLSSKPLNVKQKPPTRFNSCSQNGKGWTYYHGFCYIITEAKIGLSTIDEDFCVNLGGSTSSTLATINKWNHDYLRRLVSATSHNAVWIGLYGSAFKGFYWLDGSPYHFTDWERNEPSADAGSCVVMHSESSSHHGWNMLDCSEKRSVLCQDPVPLPRA